ncbi:TlpA disulfide reductase family protein [Desulfonatronospira sp.]|uniref:TlpA family protein disulfide reductase n=1 Tax=Desulfonatronospira sp. TaxID=1962951 RepID=UPI0025C56DD5|nr:TlpA disulfide reductase family protein [Desulfonatronospira sp.]
MSKLFQEYLALQASVVLYIVCLVLLTLLVIPPAVTAQDSAEPERVDPDGIQDLIKDEEGKVLILNFWATWCAPCRAEIRDLVSIREDYSLEDVSIIGISLDFNPAAVPPFMERKGMNYPVYISSQDVMDAYNITGIPFTLIYDGHGNLAEVHHELVDYETLQEELDRLLVD